MICDGVAAGSEVLITFARYLSNLAVNQLDTNQNPIFLAIQENLVASVSSLVQGQDPILLAIQETLVASVSLLVQEPGSLEITLDALPQFG